MSINVKVPSRFTPGRIVFNALVLVILLILLAVGFDYVANWLGYRPSLTCGMIPVLSNVAVTTALLMAFVGVVIYAFSRSPIGVGLFLGGLLVGLLPLLVNGYLVRLLGIGCV